MIKYLYVSARPRSPDEIHRVHEAVREIFSCAIELGGTTSGEHDSGLARKSCLTSAIVEINVRELKRVFGPDRLSVPNRSTCGSAGIYNIIQPAMSQRLLSRKLGHIEKPGAAIVAAPNPGCHLQIENGAKAKGQKIQALHPVSLLDEPVS